MNLLEYRRNTKQRLLDRWQSRCDKAEAAWLKKHPCPAKSTDSLKLETKYDVEREEMIAEIEEGLVKYDYDRMFPLTDENKWMQMDEQELAQSKRTPEDLTGCKSNVFKPPAKPFMPSMPTEYLEKLIDYLQDKGGFEDGNCLNRAPRLGQ